MAKSSKYKKVFKKHKINVLIGAITLLSLMMLASALNYFLTLLGIVSLIGVMGYFIWRITKWEA